VRPARSRRPRPWWPCTCCGAYDLLGRIEARRGNLEKAEEYLFKAKEIEPRWRDPYQMIGALYLQAGQVDVAIGKFEKALQESPEVIGNAYVLGMLHQQRGENDEARKMYDYVLERDENFVPALNNLAYLLADTSQDPADLKRALQLALKASGSVSAATLDTLGWVYHKTGNQEMALATLQRAMELKNDDPTILYHLAVTQADLGTKDQARALAEQLVAWPEDVPEKAQAQQLLDSL
jgi:tetratricopeptide (TPR) repeat protein